MFRRRLIVETLGRSKGSTAMRRKVSILLVCFLPGITASLLAEDPVKKLTPEHRKWLEEDAVYIITDREKEVFLSLGAAEQRNWFIEAFWERRDPNPATLENEFKIEHYRRIAHANKYFSRDAPRPGWQTDRGRFYIILGEPQHPR
jgi:GWxTD domain-containing protein